MPHKCIQKLMCDSIKEVYVKIKILWGKTYLNLYRIPLTFRILFATFCTCVCHFIFLSIMIPKNLKWSTSSIFRLHIDNFREGTFFVACKTSSMLFLKHLSLAVVLTTNYGRFLIHYYYCHPSAVVIKLINGWYKCCVICIIYYIKIVCTFV